MTLDAAVHPYLTGPYPRAFAHRGWHLDELAGMENSMASFQRALAEGFRYLEIDVHATADGVVVVHHDPTLDRTTHLRGPIAAQRWDVVGAALVGGREPVPSLRSVLEELPDALLNIDVKADPGVAPTLELIDELDAWHRVCLASFSPARLTRMRRIGGSRLITACSPADAFALRTRGWLRQVRASAATVRRVRVGGQLAQVPRRNGLIVVVDASMVAAAHDAGLEVHVWTVNDPSEMRELLDLGVDGLVTDRLDLLREVLDERGQWPWAP
jgi:glycerophosphoryl diester phosphodiesterase